MSKKPCSCKHPAKEKLEAIAEAAPHSDPQSSTEAPAGGPVCLPWVQVTKDTENFAECMKEAEKFGAIDSSKRFYEYIRKTMEPEDQEIFIVVLLDTQLRIRGVREVARGERDRVVVPINEIIRIALLIGSEKIVISHCHPSGKPKPSKADKELTKAIEKTADLFNIKVIDHIVIGSESYYSFAEHKLMAIQKRAEQGNT